MDYTDYIFYSRLSAWTPDIFSQFCRSFLIGAARSFVITLIGRFLRIPESGSKIFLVSGFVGVLFTDRRDRHLQQFARTVVAKYTRDGPMTQSENRIVQNAPLAFADVVGLGTGALAGRTPWYVLTCSRSLISGMFGIFWSRLYVLPLIIGLIWLGLWKLPLILILWFLMHLLSLLRTLIKIVGRSFGASASRIRTRMLSSLIKEQIDSQKIPGRTFRYPFVTSNRQIRLLKLERSFFQVKATLISTNIDDAPEFEAISYTWGDQKTSHQLLIDGRALPITKNAASVISHLASSYHARLLWLDSVCVDQSSKEDKVTQVKIMPVIYARASRVVVWLGDAPDADIAFDFIQELQLWRMIGPPDEEDAFDRLLQAPDDHPKYRSLRRLLYNPYWNRVWIVQEVVRARVAHINYGGRWIDWPLLADTVMDLLENHKGCLWENLALIYGLAPLPVHGLQKVSAIAETRKMFTQAGLSLPEILARFSESKATLAVDRVFALQGVSTPDNALYVEPNYNKPELDVFETATVHAFQSAMPFLLPTIACEARRATKSEHLNEHWPSWVPDLERLSDCHGVHPLCETPIYEASGGESRVRLTYSEEDHAILVYGFRLDEVRVVAQKPERFYTISEIDELVESKSKAEQIGMDMITRGLSRHDEALQLAEHECPDRYFNGELQKEAFWRTLFGNASRTLYPAEPQWGEQYAEMIRLWRTALSIQSGEAELEGLNLPENVREEMRHAQSYTHGSGEQLINTLERLLVDLPEGEVRRHLTPALANDRARLLEEIIAAGELSQATEDELRALLRDGVINSPDLQPSNITEGTWTDLHTSTFLNMPTMEDFSAAHRQMCLVLAFIYSVAGISSLSDTQVTAFRASMDAMTKLQSDLMKVQHLVSPLAATFWPRQFAVTKTGLMALVPPETSPGDLVCVFEGAKTPHVLHKVDASGSAGGIDRWRLVGEAYVHGYMDGQIVASEKIEAEEFQIL